MKLHLPFVLYFCMSLTPLYAGIIADLHQDLKQAVATAKKEGTFDHNGWTASQGGKALVFDAQLFKSNVAGFKSVADSHPLDKQLDLGNIAINGVYDDQRAEEKEIGFHPSFERGIASDLIIRWTADRDYRRLVIKAKFRRASANGNVGVAIRLNQQAFDIDEGEVNQELISKVHTYKDIKAGDSIEIVIYNGKDQRGAGDQSFGNFTLIGY